MYVDTKVGCCVGSSDWACVGKFWLPGQGEGNRGVVECVTLLSRRSPFVCSGKDLGFGSWSLGSEGWLIPFAKMDEGSSEKDLDFFCCVGCASAVETRVDKGSSSRAPIPTIKGKRNRVGVSKRRLGVLAYLHVVARAVKDVVVWDWVGLAHWFRSARRFSCFLCVLMKGRGRSQKRDLAKLFWRR